MRFEWDEDKRLANIRKHSIDFCDVSQVFDGMTATMEDDRFEYNEQRFVTLGLLKGHVICIVHTESGGVIRIISARKATRNEQIRFFRELAD